MNVFKLIEDNGLTLHGDIEHFAELVMEEEREACAKLCEEAELHFAGLWDTFAYPSDQGAADACSQVAAAIRARGEKA